MEFIDMFLFLCPKRVCEIFHLIYKAQKILGFMVRISSRLATALMRRTVMKAQFYS
jgi:hypothetical protein